MDKYFNVDNAKDDMKRQCIANSISDDITKIEIKTSSAKRVLEIVKKYGREYADGDLAHDERSKCLTGSEIPTICGENRFETPNGAFFKKVFNMRTPDNAAILHGKKYEPIAIDKFKRQTGARIFFVRFMVHDVFDFIGGTFDCVAIMPDGNGVLVEVKCPYSRSIGSYVPEYYMGQVQTYLEIANLDTCLFVQYKPSYYTAKRMLLRPERLSIVPVSKDAGYIITHMPMLWMFWKRICAYREGVMPIVPNAVIAIATVWHYYHNKGVTLLRMKLAVIEFARVRLKYRGVQEIVEHNMELNRHFNLPVKPISPTVKLTVVDDIFECPIKLCVVDHLDPYVGLNKRHPVHDENAETSPSKKFKQ